MMVLILCPNIDISPNDFDLSEAKQEVLLAVSKVPKTATEIAEEKENNFSKSIIFKSLISLQKQEMVKGIHAEIRKEIMGRIIKEFSDEKYWQLTNKGKVWVYSLGKAYDFSKEELKFLEKQATEACKQ